MRWLVAILAGVLVVADDKDHTVLELLQMKFFYVSVGLSSLIAWLLIEYIFGISKWLNKDYKGMGLNREWVLAQVFYGVGLALCLELLLATGVFAFMGYWIWETNFFRKVFGPIVMFVAIINMYFIIYYINKVPALVEKVRYQLLNQKAVEGPVDIDSSQVPVLVYVEDGGWWSVDWNGEVELWNYGLDQTQDMFAEGLFFRGRRNWIVNRDAIARVVPLSGKRLLVEMKVSCPIKLEVPRRKAAAFKGWLA